MLKRFYTNMLQILVNGNADIQEITVVSLEPNPLFTLTSTIHCNKRSQSTVNITHLVCVLLSID